MSSKSQKNDLLSLWRRTKNMDSVFDADNFIINERNAKGDMLDVQEILNKSVESWRNDVFEQVLILTNPPDDPGTPVNLKYEEILMDILRKALNIGNFEAVNILEANLFFETYNLKLNRESGSDLDIYNFRISKLRRSVGEDIIEENLRCKNKRIRR